MSETNGVFEWKTPPNVSHASKWNEKIELLKSKPGEYALIHEGPNAYSLAGYLRKQFKECRFVARGASEVYGCWIGEIVPEATPKATKTPVKGKSKARPKAKAKARRKPAKV